MTQKLTKAEFLKRIADVSTVVSRMHRFDQEFGACVMAAGLPGLPEAYKDRRPEFPIYAAIVRSNDIRARSIDVLEAAERAWEFYLEN